MIKRKRQIGSTSKDNNDDVKAEEGQTSDYSSSHGAAAKQNSRILPKRRLTSILVVVAVIILLIIFVAPKRPTLLMTYQIITLLPVFVCLYVGLFRRRNNLQQRWHHSRILPLTLVGAVVASQVPLFVAAAMGAAAVMAFSLATLTPKTNKGSPKPVLVSGILLVTVLLTENFMIWVVSATYPAGQQANTAPPPLQDNGQLLIQYLTSDLTKHDVVHGLRRVWNVQWSLVACLFASFFVTDVWGDRKLYGVASRGLWTLALARIVRTVSFCWTVLPSPVQACYAQRYPYPPPEEWSAWIWVGLLPASHGGCNDLIISGHATVTSTMACVATSMVGVDPWFAVALWTMVALDYAVEIYEGFHYSVDMWLGVVLVTLLWRSLQVWEERTWPQESENDGAPVTQRKPTVQEGVVYGIPAAVAYLQLVILPSWTSNFIIVAYVVIVVGLFAKGKQTDQTAAYLHYCQHVVLCLLFMAFGIYL
jgi:hypothetical protein